MATPKALQSVNIFKTCPFCEKSWESRDAFLDNPQLDFIGYQADFDIVEQGLFLFTHKSDDCGTTMALPVEMFLSLFSGRKYTENKQLTEECEKKCLDRYKLDRCQAHCEFAFVREVSQIIKNRFDKANKNKLLNK